MDDPVLASSAIQIPRQRPRRSTVRTTKPSIDNMDSPAELHVASTPRRPLDESNSGDNQSNQQNKKHRPHEATPPKLEQAKTSSNTSGQFGFPKRHLKHAIANNLPCYYIKIIDDGSQGSNNQQPSLMNIAKWIRQTIYQQLSYKMEEFSLFIPAGKNRYKFGVTSKYDFFKLWNCQWPDKMDQQKVEIERPRSLPDCCALVVRHIPGELPKEFICQEIIKSIKSAITFSKINYRQQRTTNDYRFCVTDANEYDEIINIGRIAIGHLLLPVTPFSPGLNMTYCNKCWELGHTRSQCKAEPKCRKCLERWQYKHQCTKPTSCAQCKGPHPSLSGECVVVQNYRRALKEEVNMAINSGVISKIIQNEKPILLQQDQTPNDYPSLKQVNIARPAWGYQQTSTNECQQPKGKEELNKLMFQVNNILEITQRLETKLDNQDIKLKRLEEMSMDNRQYITSLAEILQQTIDTVIGKSNKHKQQNLAQISHQIQDLRNNIAEKYKEQRLDSQKVTDGSNSTTIKKAREKSTARLTTTTIAESNKASNNHDAQDQSMESPEDE